MALDLNTGWTKLKSWWQSDTCFVKNPYFWLMTGGTVAAVVLTGGFLSPILGVIPFYAVATEKDVLHWVNTKNWIRKRLGYEAISPEENDTQVAQPNQLQPPHVIDDSTSKASIFHSRQFKEGLLFLSWIKEDFLKLTSSNELDISTEQKELEALFSTPLDSDSENADTPATHQASIQAQLDAYEAERQTQVGEKGLLTEHTLMEKLKENVTFARRVLIPFAEDNIQQRANLVPQHLNIFGKKIPQKKINTLYSLVYRVFQKVSQLPKHTLFSTKTSDQRLTEKEQIWFGNWMKKNNEEIAEYEKRSAIAQEKSAEHTRNYFELKEKNFVDLKECVKVAMHSNPYNFATLKTIIAIDNTIQESIQEMSIQGRFTDEELSALRKERILDMPEIAEKKQLSDEAITALIDVGILDSTTLNEKMQNLSTRNSENSLLSTDSEVLSDSSGSTTDKNSKNNLDRKPSSIKNSESIRFTGKKRDNSSIQNEAKATLALTSH